MKGNITNIINSILLVIFCTTRFWGKNLPWYISIIVRICIILLLLIANNFKIKLSKENIKLMKITMLPIIFIVIYTLLLWLFSFDMPKLNVIRNLLTSSSYLIIDLLFCYMIFSRYKNKSVDIFVNCGFISYLIGSIIPMIIKFPLESFKYLLTSYSNNYDLLYFTEVNDLTFAMGFCFLFYLLIDKRKDKQRKINMFKCVLMIFWGLKRIEIFAIILCYLFFKFVISKVSLKKSSLITTTIILLVSYFYIMFIHNNYLVNLATKYDINFMGRLATYSYVANTYSNFSLNFLGIGFGRIDEILEYLENMGFKIGYTPIISLHSDLLRMYIGIGFIAFGIWIIYQCYTKTTIIRKKIGLNCAKAYLVFTTYQFILYLTDNTYSYPITFALYFICTLCSINAEDYIVDN